MDSVLIVSGSEQGSSTLVKLLASEGFNDIDSAESGADGRQKLAAHAYDLVLINTPLSDEFGDGLALDITEETDAGVVLIVKGKQEADIESRVAKYGVLVLGRPLPIPLFRKAIHLMEAVKNRLGGMKNENVKLRQKIDDIHVINRAKGILMEYLSMTEPQAHRYLERQAMDLRITKIEVAKRLLSTYEN